MSFKDNQDLRIIADGGFAWMEHEFWKYFAPIIGPEGVAVYIAFCRVVPLAATDERYAVTVRRISQFSCVGRSKCAELMRLIIHMGMVLETKYLDGRPPSYKLASLRKLSRVGPIELLRTAGIRDTDTAPFDQEAKHQRERTARTEKRRLQDVADGAARETPLLPQGMPTEQIGETTDRAAAAGVRTADTQTKVDMSAAATSERTHVSAKPVTVSAKRVTVSATDPPIKEQELNQESSTPLPPGKPGEVGLDDEEPGVPTLPTADCTFGDAHFATSLGIATRWVMSELGITKRRVEPVIAGQLRLRCQNNRSESLQNAARLAVLKGLALHRDAEQLRHRPWSWMNFFGDGHWQRPLPYASAAARSSEATIGMNVSASIDVSRENDRARAWVLKLSEDCAVAEQKHEAEQLREIARSLDAIGLANVDQQLAEIENQLFETLFAELNLDEMNELRAQAKSDIASFSQRLTPVMVTHAMRQAMRKRLFETRALPRLSLFYMPPMPSSA